MWPEVVWGVAALAGLAPNLAFDLWFSIWIFTGSLIAGAAVIHYLARRDDHVRRAGDAASGPARRPRRTSARPCARVEPRPTLWRPAAAGRRRSARRRSGWRRSGSSGPRWDAPGQ